MNTIYDLMLCYSFKLHKIVLLYDVMCVIFAQQEEASSNLCHCV